jgi:hypothetical protein
LPAFGRPVRGMNPARKPVLVFSSMIYMCNA